MAVSLPDFNSIASTGSTTASISLAVPAKAIAGDILVICASAERAEIPVVRLNNATTGLATIRSESSTNISALFAWKRLVASDLGGTVTVTNSAARRQSLSQIIMRGAADPTFINQPISLQQTNVGVKSGPAWTPAADSAVGVGLWAIARPISPYTGYSFTTAAPFVERTEATSTYASNINATTYTTSRLLGTATSGVQQAGDQITCTSTPFDSMATMVVFVPTTAIINPTPNIVTHAPMAIIDCTASVPANGGALSYSITPSAGVIKVTEGYFAVPQTSAPQTFNIVVTETGGTSVPATVTVPAAASGLTGGSGVEIVRWHSGAWV